MPKSGRFPHGNDRMLAYLAEKSTKKKKKRKELKKYKKIPFDDNFAKARREVETGFTKDKTQPKENQAGELEKQLQDFKTQRRLKLAQYSKDFHEETLALEKDMIVQSDKRYEAECSAVTDKWNRKASELAAEEAEFYSNHSKEENEIEELIQEDEKTIAAATKNMKDCENRISYLTTCIRNSQAELYQNNTVGNDSATRATNKTRRDV